MMAICPQQHLLQVLRVAVHAAGNEGGIGPKRQRQGVERMVDTACRGGFGDLTDLGSGGVLPLGKAIYLVVEQQDIYVEIAAEEVDSMVAAYAEPITIAGNY